MSSRRTRGATEIELKLEVDPADSAQLAAALSRLACPASAGHLVSTYFDTRGRDIARAGYTLRVRREGRRRIQTVKAVGTGAGLFERREWELALPGDGPRLDQRSGPLVEALGVNVLGRIEPLFVTDVRRTPFRIGLTDGAVEAAIDEGEIRAGARAAILCELELERRSGTSRALFDLARTLNEQVPLRLEVRSKAERGYALLDGTGPDAWKVEPILLDRRGDAGEAFCLIAQSCIRQFRLNEARLLGSSEAEAEALHQARVGLRRLRSAFSLFRPLITDDAQTGLLSTELRWLASSLGGVRNIDVLVPRLEGDTRELLGAARARAFAHVRVELAGARTRLLMIDLAEWLALGTWRTEPNRPDRLGRSVLAFATEVLDARLDRLARHGEKLSELGRARRHKVRIEAKKLRYASEFFAELYTGDKAQRRHRKFVKALEALQETLGELNDLVVGPVVLAKLGIDTKIPKTGKHRRDRLLGKAEKAHLALLRAKRFW